MAKLVRYHSIIADSARWEGFAFREGDIVISTPAKCGTTWTQMICALLIFQTPDLPLPLDQLSPWLDQLLRSRESVLADLEAQKHRRFIKSHTPLDGLPFDERVTYIAVARDPRDVALSWDNHLANLNFPRLMALREAAVGLDDLPEVMPAQPSAPLPSERERFWFWMGDATSHSKATPSGLASMLHHLSTFFDASREPNVILLHYSDLNTDLEGQMRQLAARLSIEVPEERWPALVRAAQFEEMKRRSRETGPNQTDSVWIDAERFFHRARHGEWRTLLSEEDLHRYEARIREIANPELSAWVHRGSSIPA
jgi:hypothetical protein